MEKATLGFRILYKIQQILKRFAGTKSLAKTSFFSEECRFINITTFYTGILQVTYLDLRQLFLHFLFIVQSSLLLRNIAQLLRVCFEETKMCKKQPITKETFIFEIFYQISLIESFCYQAAICHGRPHNFLIDDLDDEVFIPLFFFLVFLFFHIFLFYLFSRLFPTSFFLFMMDPDSCVSPSASIISLSYSISANLLGLFF